MNTVFLSKSTEPDSLENHLKDPQFAQEFLNSRHVISDIRTVALFSDIAHKISAYFLNSTNIVFDEQHNTIVANYPKTDADFLNILHATGLYYEIKFKQNLKNGSVRDGNLYYTNGRLQQIDLPRFIFTEKELNSPQLFSNTHRVVIDSPIRLGFYGFNKYDPVWKTNNERAGPVIDLHNNSSFKNTIQNIAKELAPYDFELITNQFENVNNNAFINYNQGTDFIIINNRTKTLKDIIDNYISSLPQKSAQIISQLSISKEFERSDKEQNTQNVMRNVDYLKYLTLEDQLSIITKIYKFNETNFPIPTDKNDLKKYILQETCSSIFDLPFLLKKYPKLLNKTELKELRSKIPENLMIHLGYMKAGYGITATMQTVKIWSSDMFKKAKIQHVQDYNDKLKNNPVFKADDIIEKMKDRCFFTVPTFIYFFKNKQFQRLNEQLEKFTIPHYSKDNFAIIYDMVRADFENNTIPNFLRNEFKLNSFENKVSYDQKYNTARRTQRAKYVADISKIDKAIKII